MNWNNKKQQQGKEQRIPQKKFCIRIGMQGFLVSGVLLLSYLLLCAGLCACGVQAAGGEDPAGEYTPSPEDKLTEQEIREYIFHAREIAGKAKLIPLEREAIREMNPELDIRYRGRKRGKMTLEWKLPTMRLLRLTVTGDFLVKRPRWHLQIMTYETPAEGATYRFLGENETLTPFVPPGGSGK